MKKVYIMLSHCDSFIMKMLRFYTRTRYNHVSISIDDRIECFFSFGRRVLYFPLIGGLIKEELNKGMFEHFRNVNCLIYVMDVPDEKYEKLKDTLSCYIENAAMYKYNLAAMLGIVLNKPIHRKNRHTCSEFLAVLLTKSGIAEFYKDVSLVIPDDFNHLPGLVRIYEGPMCEFCLADCQTA